MSRFVIVEAPEPLLSAEEARAGIPALASLDDGVLEGLIAAATAELDGPSGWLGRSLGLQVLEWQIDAFPCGLLPIAMPLAPIVEIVAVDYDDTADSEVVLDPGLYRLRAGQLLPIGAWPTAVSRRGSVRIRYSAGYETAPAPILVAIKLRAGELAALLAEDGALRKRVVEGVGSREFESGSVRSRTSRAVEALVSGYRLWTI
jgi:hypothetical protein